MDKLTEAQKATNSETWEHINKVMMLLSVVQLEFSKRMFTHDRSKLATPEVDVFTEFTPKLAGSTYGSEEYKQFLKEMKPALDHHYSHNRHHPEFFENGVEGMNLIDLTEMVCDWIAAVQRHNDGNVYRSLEINTERFNLSPQVVALIKNTLDYLNDRQIFATLTTQKDI